MAKVAIRPVFATKVRGSLSLQWGKRCLQMRPFLDSTTNSLLDRNILTGRRMFFLPPLVHKHHQKLVFHQSCSEQTGGLKTSRLEHSHSRYSGHTQGVYSEKLRTRFYFHSSSWTFMKCDHFLLHAQPALFSPENRVLYHFGRTGRYYTEKCYRMCSCPVVRDT